jgi:hypothetical protein
MQEKDRLIKKLESGKNNIPYENLFLYNSKYNISKGKVSQDFRKKTLPLGMKIISLIDGQ